MNKPILKTKETIIIPFIQTISTAIELALPCFCVSMDKFMSSGLYKKPVGLWPTQSMGGDIPQSRFQGRKVLP